MVEVVEEQEAAAVEEVEMRELTPLPEMTGGAAAVEEVQSTATVERGQQEVEEELVVLEMVEILTTVLQATEGSGRGL